MCVGGVESHGTRREMATRRASDVCVSILNFHMLAWAPCDGDRAASLLPVGVITRGGAGSCE